MSYIVRQYPGEDNTDGPVIELDQHGSFGEGQISVFGRAARWADEGKGRRVTAPTDDNGRASTAICWENGKIALVLTAEEIGVPVEQIKVQD